MDPKQGDAVASLAARRGTDVVASAGPLPTNDGGLLEFRLDEPGPVSVEVELRCGSTLERVTFLYSAYATITLPNELARACRTLHRLPDALLDCDGVVVDAQGAQQAARTNGVESRVVLTDGGATRWVRTGLMLNGAELRRETSSGVIAGPVSSNESTPWVAAHDFSLAGDVLTLVVDGGLLNLPFDAGAFGQAPWALCAAASSESSRAVAFCEEPYAMFTPPSSDRDFVACSLTTGAQSAFLGACTARRAISVRQEPGSRRVLLRNNSRLFWVDLLQPNAETTAMQLSEGEFIAAPTLGNGTQAMLIHPGAATLSGGVLTGEGEDLRVLVVVGDQRASASPQLVWATDGGTTRWAPLPP